MKGSCDQLVGVNPSDALSGPNIYLLILPRV